MHPDDPSIDTLIDEFEAAIKRLLREYDRLRGIDRSLASGLERVISDLAVHLFWLRHERITRD